MSGALIDHQEPAAELQSEPSGADRDDPGGAGIEAHERPTTAWKRLRDRQQLVDRSLDPHSGQARCDATSRHAWDAEFHRRLLCLSRAKLASHSNPSCRRLGRESDDQGETLTPGDTYVARRAAACWRYSTPDPLAARLRALAASRFAASWPTYGCNIEYTRSGSSAGSWSSWPWSTRE